MLKKNQCLLLKKEERLIRRELILFFSFLEIYVSMGYDLSFAWKETSISFASFSNFSSANTLINVLSELEREFAIPRYRFTFRLLRNFYSRGTSLSRPLKAFSEMLRRDLYADLESHVKNSPLKANLVLLLFFLPPALGFLVIPFLHYLQSLI